MEEGLGMYMVDPHKAGGESPLHKNAIGGGCGGWR